MKKDVQFLLLYVYSALNRILRIGLKPPTGLTGKLVGFFFDPDEPEKAHGVVAFVLPLGKTPDDYSHDLWGPFGFTSWIDFLGIHIYGRDTWGHVQKNQLSVNPAMHRLSVLYPGQTILLAGVRKLGGRHIWPLNNPQAFVLVEKQ